MNFGNELQYNWLTKAKELIPKDLGHTLVIAPHPDDESLGCGGIILMLRKLGIDVHVIFVSDGSMSHPNSKKYPTERLILEREKEALNALEILDVPSENAIFLRLKDTKVPNVKHKTFKDTISLMALEIDKIKPQTILIPWKKDPHVDHRATWQIVDGALNGLNDKPRVLQYFIWLWKLGRQKDLPTKHEVKWYKLNIDSVIDLKQKAIAAHVSQVTNLIDDDPHGFILSPDLLKYFKNPFEIFAETNKEYE